MPAQRFILMLAIAMIAATLTIWLAKMLFGADSLSDPRFLIIAAPIAIVISLLLRRKS
jgi:hypothetical protein